MKDDYISYDLRAKRFAVKEKWLKMTTAMTTQVAASLYKPRDPEQCEDRCEQMNNEFIAMKIIEVLS